MSQSSPNLLPDGCGCSGGFDFIEDVVVRLNYDKHVIYANTQADEGQHGVHGGVREAEDGAEAHTDDHSHGDTEEARDGEIESHVDEVVVAEHEDRVDKHDEVTSSHEEGIKENRLPTDLTETLGGVWENRRGLRRTVESNLEELLLPGQRDLVSQLELQPAALTVVDLRVVRYLQPPEHLSDPCGHDVTRGVPLHAAQQSAVVGAVTEPGALV